MEFSKPEYWSGSPSPSPGDLPNSGIKPRSPTVQETAVRFLGQEDSPGEGICYPLQYSWASIVTQLIRESTCNQETWVQKLGWEDPLEKGKATYSSILAWRIPWTV